MVSSCLLLLAAAPQRIDLTSLDTKSVRQGWGVPMKDRSVDNNPLRIGGTEFKHGLGSHAVCTITIQLDGKAESFEAMVGVDDEVKGMPGDVDFRILCDGHEQFNSGVMKVGDAAKHAVVSLHGVKLLQLKVGDGGDDINYDHADWANAFIVTSGKKPKILAPEVEKPYILTPPAPRTPRINGPKVLGARPARDFVWRVPATGDRPMSFSATGVPSGLHLDPASGIFKGTTPSAGQYPITFYAKNRKGSAHKTVNLVVGDKIALTPPMGWNSWNCFANAVDSDKVLAAANAFVKAGLMNHGWQYVNIDDCWSIVPNSNDPVVGGPTRAQDGEILTNKKFLDMKHLTDSIHNMGLRAGIYSSPGPTTCGGYTACYGHEQQDAQTFAKWGFDYLKYDWCSYSQILKPEGLANLKKPYQDMDAALKQVDRDIVFSLCQYGMGDVWKWGASVGGNCWRTTGDITDSWESLSSIGFSQDGHEKFAGPGHWNDPDMLVVGMVGWGPQLHPTRLTPSEQYTHISLWCLLSSPLLIGCDMTRMDPFTMNLLTNDEVIAVNQDSLGKPAHRVRKSADIQVWARPLDDGSTAVGVFNLGDSSANATVTWSELGLKTGRKVRDLWRQKSVTAKRDGITLPVKPHGCQLIKVT